MKLSDLLEITNNYKNFKDLQPLNEAYAAEPLRQWHKFMLQQNILHDKYISKDLKYNPTDFIDDCNINGERFKENLRFLFSNVVKQYPSNITTKEFLEKIMEENLGPQVIYDALHTQYNRLVTNADVKKFIDNKVICTTNIFNIWDNIKLGDADSFPEFCAFKLANIKSDQFIEIPLDSIRQRKYSEDFIFFEDEDGKLVAISQGVRLICVFKKANGQYPVINVNSTKFEWRNLLSVSDQLFIEAYNNFQDKCYYSMAQDLVKYLYDKIFDNYNGLFTCYDIILYAKDRTLYTKNDITRDLGKLTTKVLFEKNIYGFGNVSKAYVIPKQYIDKNTNLAAYNDRWSYNYNFTNKYKTNDERILDLEYMKEQFENLKSALYQSKEFLGLTNKVSEQYDILDRKQHMLYKIYYEALKNDRKSKTSHFNKKFMGERDVSNGMSETIVSFLAGISKEIMDQQYNLINILNELRDFTAMDITKMSLQKPEDFKVLQSHIQQATSSYNTFFKAANERRANMEYIKLLINDYSDVYPDLAEIFDFSNVSLKN